uniref:deoxyribonuclease II n=1 Tax=Nothobranchius furzeri TaxID=105023 RepID=A0A8C6W155_NOTFU
RQAHITPVLQSLHWLPVEYRIQFKVLVLTYRALNNQAPSYLSELLSPHITSRNLRSTSENLLAVPRTRLKTKGDRAFQTIAPRLWNSLPSNLRVVLFDHSRGFWLSHSIPRFPSFPEKGYLYPSSGKVYGQTALCVTYQYAQLLRIVKQLVYLYPRIYNCSVPAVFSADLPQLIQLCEGSRPPQASCRRMEQLSSARGDKFVSFVKSEKYVDDIYTGWVAQVLNADLLVESWQNQGHALPSNCSLPKHAMNIKRIQLPTSIQFQSRYDHSKWCVSRVYEDHVTCLGDLNREKAQLWGGGGLICTYNPVIYKAFRQLVDCAACKKVC